MQAFPHDEKNDDGSHHYSHLGMTLRDYFAAAALTGIIARNTPDNWESRAEKAYRAADEMLRARNVA